MSSLTIHATVPLLFLLAVRRIDARKVWVLWPLTILYDLDYFLGIHRTATNVWTLLPFLGALAWALRTGRRGLAEWMTVALVYLASHLVMDTFTGGTVLLYPLSDRTFCYYAEILVRTADNTMVPSIEDCSHPGVPTVAEVYPWLSGTDAATLMFVLPAGLVMAGIHGRRLWRERTARRDTLPPP